MDYLYPAIKWAIMFPITFFCAVFSGVLLIDPHLIPANWLLANYFNGNTFFNFWFTVLIPFFYAYIQLAYKLIVFKKKLTHDGKKSKEFLFETYHIPAFAVIDTIAVVCLIICLFVTYCPDAAKPEYYKIHSFEPFLNIMVMPFISIVNYWGKLDREKSKPNFIINHVNQ